MKLVSTFLLTLMMAAAVSAQRPRAIPAATPADATKATPAPAPQTMKAKYEGGIFGYNKTMEGTLSFDDTNQRLCFARPEGNFLHPYNAVNSAFSDTQNVVRPSATVAQNILTWLAGGSSKPKFDISRCSMKT